MVLTYANGSTTYTEYTAELVLQINPPSVTLDSYAETALSNTETYFINQAGDDDPRDYITSEGLLSRVNTLTEKLNGSGLDNIPKLLLSRPIIYATLIKAAREDESVSDDDLEGLYSSVLRNVNNIPKRYFLAQMLTLVLNDRRIRLKSTDKRWEQLDDLTLSQGLPITIGQVEPAVTDLLSTLYTEGNIPYYVAQFAERDDNPISPYSFTASLQQGMTDYLVKLGIEIDDDTFTAGGYDQYFLMAYNEALKTSTVAEDPIDAARVKGGETTWDFSVDTFESIEEQGVSSDNILAAGALDYIYCIGERMHVFDVANALVLRWASGMLDVPEGTTAAALYRYHKLRSERSTPQERAMLYRRVLNRGAGRLLSNMVPNEDFPRLWHQLMSEVAEYIRKAEGSYSADGWVSRAPIYQATKNLQYNLSENMTGMSHLQVTEDYAHLQEALDIIKSEDVVISYGGRRQSIWTVIEQIAKEDLGIMVSSAPIRTAAVEGNKVFQWIATFNEGSVQDSIFQNFLSSAEAWIIAQAAMEEDDDSFGQDDDDMDDDIDMDEDDDFDDWN
ncbi:hypothetical protein QGP82_12670 [Leptothoe sp. LEGE 181152]|uniref:hypothetical protein n=1 Tax=Adonisia turfae TaxID=2950184 RepID=UPI002029B2B0|nr:hypothetical protein [Adonisia turfae]MDV3349550.1 hypothetical protein [Leptothoe sp. LEGE 181152]